jgi:hypothetical protein
MEEHRRIPVGKRAELEIVKGYDAPTLWREMG